MLRNGYWFNLEKEEWEPKEFPPNNVFETDTDSIYYFQGKPTIFGGAACDLEGNCSYTEVIQYDPELDLWDSIGTISESKQFHEVVEVPKEVCDHILVETTTTEAASGQTTTEAVTDPYVAPDTSTVAMIIGGSWNEASRMTTMSSVELFGCPGYEERSFPLADFPKGAYLMGATYFPNKQDVGKVVACGGFQCGDRATDSGFCELAEKCYEWTLNSGSWVQTPDLDDNKWNFLMTLVQNLDNFIDVNGEQVLSDELVPMAIGGNEQTEIYDPSSREWTRYRDVPSDTDDWMKTNCLIQIDNYIYYIGSTFVELDTLTWEITREFAVPDFLQNPGMCSQARVKNIEGNIIITCWLVSFNSIFSNNFLSYFKGFY